MHAYMHVCIIVCMYVNLIDLSQRGLFRAYETDYWNKFNRLRIPAGRKHWPVGHVQIHLRSWTKGYLKQIHQVVREGLHLRISRFQIQCPNQSLMLPRLQLLGEVCNMTQKNQSKKKKKIEIKTKTLKVIEKNKYGGIPFFLSQLPSTPSPVNYARWLSTKFERMQSFVFCFACFLFFLNLVLTKQQLLGFNLCTGAKLCIEGYRSFF